MVRLDRLAQWRRDGVPPPVAPSELRRWWRRLQGGRAHEAIGQAGSLAERLAADPERRGWVPAVVLAAGAALAAAERNVEARQHLREGLEMLPGTPSVDLVGDGSWHALLLVELCTVTGEAAEARQRAEPLARPGHGVEIRLGAVRSLAGLRQAAGDHEGAHRLLHTATDLATACRSRLLDTVVEADRATVLALQGRTAEAVLVTDVALGRLLRPSQGPHAVLALRQAATTAATVARACADEGDGHSAARLVALAHDAAARSGRQLPVAITLVAEAAGRRVSGDLTGAELTADAATRVAQGLAAAPIEALARLESGRVALAAGLHASAQPVLADAAARLQAAGLPVEAAAAARLLHPHERI